MEIAKAATMGQRLEYDMDIAHVLEEAGMDCVDCPSSICESSEEACKVHGLDSDHVFQSSKDYLSEKV